MRLGIHLALWKNSSQSAVIKSPQGLIDESGIFQIPQKSTSVKHIILVVVCCKILTREIKI